MRLFEPGLAQIMFLGSYQHKIDGKGRLILPSAFRSRLADGAVVTPLDSCLGVLPIAEFERLARKLEAQVSEGSVPLNALRCLAGSADRVSPDAQGRVRIQPRLREMAGLSGSVMVTGAYRRVEVWALDRWDEVSSAGPEELSEVIAHGRGIGDV